jgi:hypothetical protein
LLQVQSEIGDVLLLFSVNETPADCFQNSRVKRMQIVFSKHENSLWHVRCFSDFGIMTQNYLPLKMEAKRLKKRSNALIMAMGVVTPAKWDENDNIIGISIQTLDEEEYIVEFNKIGQELITCMGKRVEASGSVRERLDGKRILKIKSYKMIDNYGEDRETGYM